MNAPERGPDAQPGDIRLPALAAEEQRLLLRTAKTSIAHGLCEGRPLAPDLDRYSVALREPWAVFVTLHRERELRGCIGTTEATAPLAAAVAKYAWYAAFQDTRFLPVMVVELPELEIQISILSPPAPLRFASEDGLLQQLQPGADGVLIEDGPCHATFLPAVWEALPDPRDFLRHLKRKAGLSPDYWSAELRASRYRACCFSAPAAALDTLE